MKKIKAFEETNYIFTEKFLSQHVNLILEEQNPESCTLNPSDIKNILMRNPESLENVNKFIEYLIMNNKTSSDDIISLNSLESPSLSYDEIMKTLSIFQYLGEKMIKIMNYQQIPELNTFFVKPLENDENYNQGTLIFTYAFLIEIIRSNFHYKNATYDKKYENLSQIHELFKNYSIQSNFSPFNSILIQKIDNNNDINTLLKGIAPGSSEIFRRGIISNGHFLFVLNSHFYLSLFPICIENGGLFSPLICKFKVDSNAEDVSLSLESNKMVVTAGSYQFKFDIKTLIESSTFSIDEQCQEIEPTEKVRIQNKEYFVSDGVVNVRFSQSKGKTLATIKFVDTQKVINIVCLHKKEGDEKLYESYPLDDFNDLFSWPFETNGLVLSFYIKIDPNQILCRQFSLIDGSHIKDEIIDSNINISAISFDSINQIHYTAINNNNQLIIYSLSGSFDCSVNPFLFGFSIPDLDQNLLMKPKKLSLFQSKDVFLKSEKEIIYQISSILLSSIFLKKNVGTFLIDERDNVFVFPLFIEEIVQSMNDHSNSVDKSKETIMNNIKIAALQIISILFVINVKHHIQLTKDQEFITKIQSSLIKMFHELIQIKEQYTMSVISYIYLNLFEYIDFTGVTEESQVFVSILGELLCYFSPVQIKFVIHVLFENSEKFSSLSFIKFSDKNIFYKYIAGNFPLSKIHPNILSFLLCHQRCVVNQLNKSLEKEHFSAYSLFADINYKDCKTGNESLNNFAEYTNFIVNQFTNSIAYSSSYDIIEKTVIHYLFDNFLMLIIGLYKYHEVAQVVTPMLFLIQTAIKNNIDLSKEENENALQIINKIGIVFGAFTGTLIKGGNLSFYDEKYKWLIRPNMHLITEPNKLYELDNPTINLESFIDHNVKLFLSHSSDELINGKNILQDIYKKWNFNMNKNLNQTLLDLDQLFLATELYHLNLFEEAKKRNINKLRPALHQMMRVRNTARSILRSKEPSRNIWIINEENIPINEKERSNYSPIDLIVIKCKMLLKLTSKFDSENIADAPKLIADFVLSNDQPSMLINYISNQRNRLRLTDIGFSLLEESYSLKMHELFLRVIDTTLSISVDNFDGLSTIILYDNEHKAEEHIYKFIRKVLDNIEYPYLILISYKLIESNILSNDLLGKIIEDYMNKSCENITFFALFHNKIHLVKNISDSKLFLFEDSKTGNKVSFNSLPIDDYYKITADEWYFLSQSPDKSTKSYSNVLQYFVNSDFNNDLNNLDNLIYLSRYINSFYDDFSESIQLDSVKKDFSLLLKSLGESITKNTNFERANEIVSFFRRILNKHNKHSTLLIEIIQSFNKNKFAYDNDSLCAIFAILGGFIDVTQLYNIVTFRINRETLKTGILLNQNEVLEIPININSKPIKTSSYYATSLVPFSCSMFPDSKFIFSFIKYATNNLTNPILSFYLKSLTFYLNEDSDFTLQDAKYLFGKIYSLMKPFDTIKDTEQIISILNSKKKVEPLKDCHFSILANQSTNCTTYLSPILKNNTLYKIKIESFDGFIGYFGFINDDPLSKHIPFLIFDSINGNVIPDYCNKTNEKILNNCSSSKILEFSVDPARKSLIINDKSKTYSYNIESTKSSQYLKLFINAVNPTQIKSIQVFSPSSNSSNSMNQYAYNNNSLYTKINNNNNNNNSTSIIKLINFIKPITYKIEDIYVNFDRVDERDYPSFSIPNYIDIPFNPLISNKQILYHYSMADTISTDLKNYICKHVHLKLLGQLATLIIMKFVNIGFGDILLNFSNNIYSIKLFSYLQIPLEPFNNDKLRQKEFPFSLNKSILNDKSSFIPNQQFDNIEFEMKKCLQKIITLHPKIQETIKLYIDSLMNSLLVQTLRNRSNVESYHFYKPTFNYEFSRTSNIESIIIFFPYLYQFYEKSIRLNQASVEFPYILNMNNNDNDEITIEYMQKTDISFFSIDKYNNHWVFESPFEILLLLKEYYLIFKDSLYVRQTLIDLFIMNSPIVSVFVPKLLKYYSEKSLLRKKQFTQDYLKQLYIVQLIQKKYPNKKDADLTVFMSNEHEIYKSPFLASLIPYFPEFFGMYDDDMQQDSNELISMPLTNLDSKLIYNPLQIFTKCTSIFKEKFNLIYYLQIWLSVSLLYMNNNSDIEIIVEDSNAERSSFQCKFNPSQIHDIFLNEMKIVQNEIKKDYVSQFAYSIHYSLLTQKSFEYLLENSLYNFDHISLLPRRVVVIIIYIIYQINYVCSLHENLIPKSEIDSVSNLLNFTTTFLKLIVVNESNANYISINRFEAHRMEIDGNGNQKSSIIAQVSDMLSSNPENFQQKESNVWHVRFINEKALDVGGPTRELYTEIASSIIEKTSGLFIISPNGRNNVGKSNKNVYIPFHTKSENKKLIELNQKEIEKCYVAVGVYLGIIVRNGFYQDLPFAPIVWKLIINQNVDENDIFSIDEDFKDFIINLRNASNDIDLFEKLNQPILWNCINWDGSIVGVPNQTSSNTVTFDTLNIYIDSCIKLRIDILKKNVDQIYMGFSLNTGVSKFPGISWLFISNNIQGPNTISVDQLKSVILLTSDNIKNKFWTAVEQMNDKQRFLLIRFATGFAKIPSNRKDFHITITELPNSNRLPQAATCFQNLSIPNYDTSEIMLEKLVLAIESCQTMEEA